MNPAERSLLSFVDTPVLVGDPDGCAAYVNPAFEECFEQSGDGVVGRPLAELFEGGGREAVLRAVAGVCESGESVRFRVRERGVGFAGTASPIKAGDESVGVVILLKEELDGVERLIAMHREIQDPLDDLQASLDTLMEQTGGRRNDAHRSAVEDAQRALVRLGKWAEEVNAVLCGAPPPSRGEEIDPASLMRSVERRVAGDARSAGVEIETVCATSLAKLRADSSQLEAILVRLVRERLEAGVSKRLFLGARMLRDSAGKEFAALLSVVECGSKIEASTSSPALVKEVVASSGGEVQVVAEPGLGRATVIRLPLTAAA